MTTPSATRITDWDHPGLPLLLRLFNAVAGWPTRTFVSLEPEDVGAIARYWTERAEDLGIDPEERRTALAFYQEQYNVPEG